MTDWIRGHIDRMDRGTGRKKQWNGDVLVRGLMTAWDRPDVLAMRYADLMESEPGKYRTEALGRIVITSPHTPDIDTFFAMVCLNSTGLWSTGLDRARPACALVVDARGGAVLASELARAVLNHTQDGGGARGRAPTGVLEEIRDLGVAMMLADWGDADRLAIYLKHTDARQVYRAQAVWRHSLT